MRAARAAALALWWCGAAAAWAAPPPAAVVNGEPITASDVERASRLAAPETPRKQILEALVEETLLVQEARRLKLHEGDEFRRAVRRWRQDQANGLVGIEELRLHLERKGRKPGAFGAFYARAREAWAALPKQEQEQVDAAVQRRFTAITASARAPIDTASLEKYARVMRAPPERARQVVAARVPWGTITLEDVYAAQPDSAGHMGQSPAEVLRMWQQIVNEIVSRERIVAAAEESGLFKPEQVRQESRAAEREALRNLLVEADQRKRLAVEALSAWVGRQAPTLARERGMSVEVVTLAATTRVEADAEFEAFTGGKAAPATRREQLPLDKAWGRLTPDQRRLLMQQTWGSFSPLLRVGGSYVALRLTEESTPESHQTPEGQRTLKALAESSLGREAYRRLVAELAGRAVITFN